MRVFVSGATGFIGSHLSRALMSEGHQVRTVARPSPRAEAAKAQGVDVHIGDLRDTEVVGRAIEGCRLVHHLATVRTGATVDRLAKDPVTRAGYRADVDATRTVVDAAMSARVEHFVFTSSAGVHGRLEDVPANESHPVSPDTAHRRAKAEGEEIVRDASEVHGLSTVIARPTTVYGPGDERVGKFFRMIAAGEFRMLGPGDHPYHMTYVDDVVRALRLCEEWRDEPGAAVLVGSEQVPTLREFFEAVANAAGVPLGRSPVPIELARAAARASRILLVPVGIRPKLIRNVEFFTLPRAFDVRRARETLGFRSVVDLEDGVRRTWAWVRGHRSAA